MIYNERVQPWHGKEVILRGKREQKKNKNSLMLMVGVKKISKLYVIMSMK